MTDLLPVPIGGTSLVKHQALEEALNAARDYALAEKSAGTLRANLSDWRQFEAWCGTMGLVPLPAAVNTVAAYLGAVADAGLKASTINRRIAAIAFRHSSAGLEPPTSSEAVKRVARGIRRTIGTASVRKAPAIAKVVRAFVRTLPNSLWGRRDAALMLLGFAAALRGSELVGLQVADLERVPEGLLVHVRKSKTDQEGRGHVIAVPHGSKMGVVVALDAWLAAAGIVGGPVFRAIGKGGHLAQRALSDRAVRTIIKQAAEKAGFAPDKFSSHSLRAGLVTEAMMRGAEPFRVMDITRHKSVDTLRIYDRQAKAFKNHAGAKFL